MDRYESLSQIGVTKTLSLDLTTDFTSHEGELDSAHSLNVLRKRKLPFQPQSNTQLDGKFQVTFEKLKSCPCDFRESTPKRRRFQRRNSKTAKMLSMSMLPGLVLDLPGEETSRPSCAEYDEDISIAEDLVRHFQSSRKRAQSLGKVKS